MHDFSKQMLDTKIGSTSNDIFKYMVCNLKPVLFSLSEDAHMHCLWQFCAENIFENYHNQLVNQKCTNE